MGTGQEQGERARTRALRQTEGRPAPISVTRGMEGEPVVRRRGQSSIVSWLF